MYRLLIPVLAIVVGSWLPALTGQADTIYRWVDQHGRPQFADTPPADQRATPVELGRINTYDSPSPILIEETLARPVSKPGRRSGVVMYSTTWCGVCTRAKNWLKAHSIRFVEYDVEKSEPGKRDFKKLGARGVPVILVGKQRMNGFSEANMRTMLRNAGYSL
jgi:glutaredoxin